MSNPSDANLPGDDAIQALREALRTSPNNTALRLHFAATLLAHGHAGEAEKEYRAGVFPAGQTKPCARHPRRPRQAAERPGPRLPAARKQLGHAVLFTQPLDRLGFHLAVLALGGCLGFGFDGGWLVGALVFALLVLPLDTDSTLARQLTQRRQEAKARGMFLPLRSLGGRGEGRGGGR